MIIGIDASRANLEHRTGTEWVAFYIIEQLKRRCRPSDTYLLYSKEPLRGTLGILPPNFKSRVLRWPPRFLWTQLRLAWEMLVHAPDVLYIPAHTVPIVCPRRTVVTLHDVGFEVHPELYAHRSIGPRSKVLTWLLATAVRVVTLGQFGTSELDYHRWSVRHAFRKAARVITISNFSKREMVKYFHAPPDLIAVISNAYNTKFKPVTDRLEIERVLQRYGIAQPYIFYVGRLERKKNTVQLVQAFSEFARRFSMKHQLVLTGSPGFGYDEVERAIANSSAASQVKIIGRTPDEDLPTLMSAAQLFVFPSAYEGFGMPVLEAMACGVPVVASRIEALREVAGPAATYVDPHDVPSFAATLHSLSTNVATRDALIREGFERCKLYTWEQTADRLHQLLISL